MDIQKIYQERFLLEKEYGGEDKPVNRIEPLVSVCVITYQHVAFIKDCLEGILMQQTDFPFEIIIGEDESTDGTREICIEYANKYPDKIRLFLRDRKTSQLFDETGKYICRFNGKWNRESARGKYIALCEGDDYWTDPLKLQKQVDFLESNPEFSLVCGGYKKRYAESDTLENVIVDDRKIFPNSNAHGFEFNLDDLGKTWLTKTLTALFRADSFDPKELLKYRFQRDVHLFYHIIKNGKGMYFQEAFGVYNIHGGGVHSMQELKTVINTGYRVYNELFQFNKDSYSREKAFKATLKKLSFDLRNKYEDNDRNNRLRLIFQAYSLVRSPREVVKIKKVVGKYLYTTFKSIIKN